MSKFSKEKLKIVERKLIAEKEQLLQAISGIEAAGLKDTMADASTELSMYDNHPADISEQLFERSKDVALIDNANVELKRIEMALDKIKKGTYGECNHCGKSIEGERLDALPSATLCIYCQEEADERELSARPLEEEVLVPPFYQNYLAYDRSYSDGVEPIDILQSVMKYGSSDSPADTLNIDDDDKSPSSNDEQLHIIRDADPIIDDD